MLIKFLQNEYNIYFIYLSLILLFIINNKIEETKVLIIYFFWYTFVIKSEKIRKILY